MSNNHKPVILINTFTLVPGKLDEFVELQAAQARRNKANPILGFQGGRMFRSVDGTKAVLVTAFDSIDAHKQLMESGAFKEHRDRILPLIQGAEPAYYELAYETERL